MITQDRKTMVLWHEHGKVLLPEEFPSRPDSVQHGLRIIHADMNKLAIRVEEDGRIVWMDASVIHKLRWLFRTHVIVSRLELDIGLR